MTLIVAQLHFNSAHEEKVVVSVRRRKSTLVLVYRRNVTKAWRLVAYTPVQLTCLNIYKTFSNLVVRLICRCAL